LLIAFSLTGMTTAYQVFDWYTTGLGGCIFTAHLFCRSLKSAA
jgi:hypothetical protein